MFEEDLVAFILAQSPSIVGDRVRPLHFAREETLPAMTYARVSTSPSRTMDGDLGRDRVRMRLQVKAATFLEARTIAGTLRTLLNDFSGLMGSTTVKGVSLEGDTDLYDEAPKAYRTVLDFMFTIKET